MYCTDALCIQAVFHTGLDGVTTQNIPFAFFQLRQLLFAVSHFLAGIFQLLLGVFCFCVKFCPALIDFLAGFLQIGFSLGQLILCAVQSSAGGSQFSNAALISSFAVCDLYLRIIQLLLLLSQCLFARCDFLLGICNGSLACIQLCLCGF